MRERGGREGPPRSARPIADVLWLAGGSDDCVETLPLSPRRIASCSSFEVEIALLSGHALLAER